MYVKHKIYSKYKFIKSNFGFSPDMINHFEPINIPISNGVEITENVKNGRYFIKKY